MAPKVSIVIPTYLKEAERYLTLALESIANLNYPKHALEIIVVSSGHEPVFANSKLNYLPSRFEHYHSKERLHFASAVNKGVELTSLDSKYYFIVSDDVILTKNSLKNMVEMENDSGVIVQGLSNCDNGRKFVFPFPLNQEKQKYRYEEWANIKTELMNAESTLTPGMLLYDYLCFYAVLINKKAWDKIGKLDENFKSGQEDIDYCKRATQKSVPCAIISNALIWHFSGVSADLSLDDKIRTENIEYYNKKWR